MYQLMRFTSKRHSSSQACSVPIMTRSEWGGQPPAGFSPMPTPVNHVFIHHSAGQFCNTKSQCIKTVQGIQNYHQIDQGNLLNLARGRG